MNTFVCIGVNSTYIRQQIFNYVSATFGCYINVMWVAVIVYQEKMFTMPTESLCHCNTVNLLKGYQKQADGIQPFMK